MGRRSIRQKATIFAALSFPFEKYKTELLFGQSQRRILNYRRVSSTQNFHLPPLHNNPTFRPCRTCPNFNLHFFTEISGARASAKVDCPTNGRSNSARTLTKDVNPNGDQGADDKQSAKLTPINPNARTGPVQREEVKNALKRRQHMTSLQNSSSK